MAKREQEQLVLKRAPQIVSVEDDKVTLVVDINGLIDPKEGKETHVVAHDAIKLVRSDGKVITLQLSAYYK